MIRGSLVDFVPNQNRAVVHIYEDIPGGCTLVKSELRYGASGYLSEGIMISMVSGFGHLCKTGSLWRKNESAGSGLLVDKSHEFKPGDNISFTSLKSISREIISIDTSSQDYDSFYLGSGFGCTGLAGSVLVEVNSAGVSGTAA